MVLDQPPERFNWIKKSVSIFYMPIIAHAFLVASEKDVPGAIIRSTGNLINLDVGEDKYNLWLNELVKYLKINNNLKNLELLFKKDKQPSEKGPGHIKGKYQNKILEKINIDNFSLDGIINSYIYKRYPLDNK